MKRRAKKSGVRGLYILDLGLVSPPIKYKFECDQIHKWGRYEFGHTDEWQKYDAFVFLNQF